MSTFHPQKPGSLPPPRDFSTLKQRVDALLGQTVGQLALRAGLKLPSSSLSGKGFVGELIEHCLGADARGAPQPDFLELGVELKTMPVDINCQPLESTFLTSAPLTDTVGISFEHSVLFSKIRQVLWVFILSTPELELSERRVIGYHFWAPDPATLLKIRRDFEEIYELINSGHIEDITAELGEVIQLRPKAANGRVLTEARGPEGELIRTRPRGFYLRRSFTKTLIDSFLHPQAAT